jgi:putative oxidoreductase
VSRYAITPARTAARIFTGSSYAILGYDAFRAPGARVQQAAETLALLRRVLPLPEDDVIVVRGNGAIQAACGLLLASGRCPRLAALAIAGSLISTTVAGHAFWKLEDPAARKAQRTQFVKNMAMLGGLLLAVTDASARSS